MKNFNLVVYNVQIFFDNELKLNNYNFSERKLNMIHNLSYPKKVISVKVN